MNKELELAKYCNKVPLKKLNILNKLIMQKVVSERRYLEKTYSLTQLAKELHTNTRYVSATLQLKHYKTYKIFINELRIKYAIKLLQKNDYALLTDEEMAHLVGFANRQPFTKWFMFFTNKTFSEYKKQLIKKIL